MSENNSRCKGGEHIYVYIKQREERSKERTAKLS